MNQRGIAHLVPLFVGILLFSLIGFYTNSKSSNIQVETGISVPVEKKFPQTNDQPNEPVKLSEFSPFEKYLKKPDVEVLENPIKPKQVESPQEKPAAVCDMNKYVTQPVVDDYMPDTINQIANNTDGTLKSYPERWSKDLLLDSKFKLVNTLEGPSIYEGSKYQYIAIYKYEQTTLSSSCAVLKNYINNGWNLLEVTSYKDRDYNLHFEKGNYEKYLLAIVVQNTEKTGESNLILELFTK